MARVFDALRRDQKRKKSAGEHDPLARTILHEATPEPEEEEVTGFELTTRIGAPTGPRSNEGMLLPGAARALTETEPLPAAPSAALPAIAPAAAPTVRPTATPIAAPPLAFHAASEPAPETALAGEPAREYHAPRTQEPPHVARAQVRTGETHARLLMLHEPHAAGCEQYRTLRTELFHAAERELTQVIVVASALAGEGKTATTLNLAFAIAQSPNRRVLVIDGDLRRPSIASYLGLNPFSGFAEVLQDRSELFDSVTKLNEHELYLLPVKRETRTPTELLSSPRFEETLRELRRYFDFILIDSPPVKPYADARLLANHADATLFVVRAGFAPYETVEQAVHALNDVRVLGVVLNGAAGAQAVSSAEDYQLQQGRDESANLIWSTLGPRVRDSWLGRRFKL